MGAAGPDAYTDGSRDWYDDKADGDSPAAPIDVNLGDLAQFAKDMNTELGRFTENWEEGVNALLLNSMACFGTAGGDLFPATFRLRQLYTIAESEARQFYAEALQGLTAFSWAAETIAIEYEDGDIEGQEGLDAINDSFSPDDQKRSLQHQMDELQGDDEEGDDSSSSDQPEQGTDRSHDVTEPSDDGAPADPGSGDGPTTVSPGEDGEYEIPEDPYSDAPPPPPPPGT